MKIYADGSNLNEMVTLAKNNAIAGFTTNPTLMRNAGITDYEQFARQVLEQIPHHPISFEVFADEYSEMKRQAQKLASLGNNVYVKIPITNTQGKRTTDLIKKLLDLDIKVNVTAVLSLKQIRETIPCLESKTPAIISIFAGRIADTGIDPKPFIREACGLAKITAPNVEVLWASCREVYNIYEAKDIGCHIITVPNNLISKLELYNKDLDEYSLETVKMFHSDAEKSRFVL